MRRSSAISRETESEDRIGINEVEVIRYESVPEPNFQERYLFAEGSFGPMIPLQALLRYGPGVGVDGLPSRPEGYNAYAPNTVNGNSPTGRYRD